MFDSTCSGHVGRVDHTLATTARDFDIMYLIYGKDTLRNAAAGLPERRLLRPRGSGLNLSVYHDDRPTQDRWQR